MNDVRLPRLYAAWKKRHPHALALYLRFAREALAAKRPFSMALLNERVRWETNVVAQDKNPITINNNFRPLIAQDLIKKIPGIKELIRTRTVAE